MKLKNILLFMVMLLALSFSAFAAEDFYETNQTISLDATYTQGGVLAHANANYTVELPNGDIDVNQVGMTEISTGIFSGNYTTSTQTGKTKITVIYYDDSWVELGRDSRYIQVGYAGAFTLGESPQTTTQLTTMWVVLGVLLLLAVMGLSMKISILTLFAGIILLIMCVVTFPFSTIIGVINLMVGIIFLLAGGFSRSD